MKKSCQTTSYSKHTVYLFVLIFISAAAYVYFLNMSVVHVVMQKEIIRETQVVKNDIVLLESSFIKAQHRITERMASLDGVIAEKNKIFVKRNSDLAANQ